MKKGDQRVLAKHLPNRWAKGTIVEIIEEHENKVKIKRRDSEDYTYCMKSSLDNPFMIGHMHEKSKPKPRYFIGADQLSYTLLMKDGDDLRFLLVKTIADAQEFWEEVDALAKAFNAEICKER